VLSAAFGPGGKTVATASRDGTVRLWWDGGTSGRRTLTGHTRPVTGVAFSADGLHLVSASADSTARVWTTSGGPEMVLRGHTGAVESARFDPPGEHVVTASADGTARLWRVGWRPLVDHIRASTSACLTADDRTRLLGEPDDRARERADECERRNGRRTGVAAAQADGGGQ
jgi:WD40 repeat protein